MAAAVAAVAAAMAVMPALGLLRPRRDQRSKNHAVHSVVLLCAKTCGRWVGDPSLTIVTIVAAPGARVQYRGRGDEGKVKIEKMDKMQLAATDASSTSTNG